jgi:colicin import membrane protein
MWSSMKIAKELKNNTTLTTLTDSQKRGAFATVAFHTAVLLFLLYSIITAPFPPLPDGGILLDFGNSETGIGLEEPSAAQGAEKQIADIKTAIVPKSTSTPSIKSKAIEKEQEELLTQDYENTIALNSAAKKKAANDKKVKDEERILNEKAEKQKRLEEI